MGVKFLIEVTEMIYISKGISEASVGDSVTLMLSGKAPIYEQDGLCTVFRYYTVSVRPKLKFDSGAKT